MSFEKMSFESSMFDKLQFGNHSSVLAIGEFGDFE